MAHTQRHSGTPISKNKPKIGMGSIVCKEAEIRGEVVIGSKTVIHPKARILALNGPIKIGDGNLIEEQTCIINQGDNGEGDLTVMEIGNNNFFEVGSHCEAIKVGNNNILECKSKVGQQVILGDGCVIGACCELTTNETLPDNTVVFGKDCQRRVQSERPLAQTLQLDFLTKVLPNYHHLQKNSRN
ncbi:dynactin subunit 6-like [Dendronephthya gigantea]|uniref:dynactin subunit 6-like n=1 Tax=Dendronephthya gigantea TaxID=151771 RepID=UPI001069A46A|nr:dynactin subunit 6-like [Dendronephthya gigantea]